jgi:amino-acid N-acetyltransferase
LESNAAKSNLVVRNAAPNNIDEIYEIIASYSKNGIILERSHENIKASISCFYVAEINGSVAGVISYYDYGDHLKEIRSLGVKKGFLRQGIGSALLRKVIQPLCEGNNPKIFVLTYTPEFFERNGFSIIPKDTLPEKIWKDCVKCKNIDICNETALEYHCNTPQARSVGF